MPTVDIPGALAEATGGMRHVTVEGHDLTVRSLLVSLQERYPLLDRRIRDETGELRRHVNVYVDGVDIRSTEGLNTAVGSSSVVHVLPSVAGG